VTPASATTIARLVKVLGMLGSPHVGEGAAAGLKADQLVKQLGLRWPDIIAVERAPTTVAADGGEISWRAMLSFGASTSRRSAPRATAWTTSNARHRQRTH
jgi:hypothetical protein